MQSIQECSPLRQLVDEGEGDREDDDLRNRLHAMETKAKRLRNQRNSFSDDARSAAEQRDAIQNQAKEIRESINSLMEEQKKIRERAKVHRTRRDDIQAKIRELIGRSKGRREDNKNSRSVVVQLAETESEISNIEDRIMTDGTLSLDKENKLLKKLKTLRMKRKELLPSVEEHTMIKLDLKNLDGSILHPSELNEQIATSIVTAVNERGVATNPEMYAIMQQGWNNLVAALEKLHGGPPHSSAFGRFFGAVRPSAAARSIFKELLFDTLAQLQHAQVL